MSTNTVGRPVGPTSADLSDADYEAIDEGEFDNVREWRNRMRGAGATSGYSLGDFPRETLIDNLDAVIRCHLRLRARWRESKNAAHLRELEQENVRMSRRIVELETGREVAAERRRLITIIKSYREEIQRLSAMLGIHRELPGEFDGK